MGRAACEMGGFGRARRSPILQPAPLARDECRAPVAASQQLEDRANLSVDRPIGPQDAVLLAADDVNRRVRMERAWERRERLVDHGRRDRGRGDERSEQPAHAVIVGARSL